VDFWINSHLIEYGQISQWTEKLSGQDGQKIDHLFGVVIKLDPQSVWRFYLE
jgi:abortive infection bacteriophage resistance protein